MACKHQDRYFGRTADSCNFVNVCKLLGKQIFLCLHSCIHNRGPECLLHDAHACSVEYNMLKWRKCDLKVKSELILAVKTCITSLGVGTGVDKPLEEKFVLRSRAECSNFSKRMNVPVLQRCLMPAVPPCRANTELDLMVREVCRTASGHPWGEKGCGKELGAPLASQGLRTHELPSPFLPSYLHPGRSAERSWVYLCADSSFCLSFSSVIRSSYRKAWITGEKAKKIPKSKNKAKQEGVKHELARAKGLALILLSALVFIQRQWIQVNFLGSIFIAVLLALNWNNERFVDWVQRLSRFILSPSFPCSICRF